MVALPSGFINVISVILTMASWDRTPLKALSVGLPGSAEVQRDAVGIGPQVKVSGEQLGPLIGSHGVRVAPSAASPVKGLDYVFRPLGVPGSITGE